jgi:DNA-binding XRE family transcriptional regulator
VASLQQRLDRCRKRGALSRADLALWLDVSYQTLYDYLKGAIPHEYRRSQIEQKLKWLEEAVDGGQYFPLAFTIRQKDRAALVLQIRAKYAR